MILISSKIKRPHYQNKYKTGFTFEFAYSTPYIKVHKGANAEDTCKITVFCMPATDGQSEYVVIHYNKINISTSVKKEVKKQKMPELKGTSKRMLKSPKYILSDKGLTAIFKIGTKGVSDEDAKELVIEFNLTENPKMTKKIKNEITQEFVIMDIHVKSPLPVKINNDEVEVEI